MVVKLLVSNSFVKAFLQLRTSEIEEDTGYINGRVSGDSSGLFLESIKSVKSADCFSGNVAVG